MISILHPDDRRLLKMAREIRNLNLKIDAKLFQILLHKMNNDENQRVSTQFDLCRLRDQKEELMALMDNI